MPEPTPTPTPSPAPADAPTPADAPKDTPTPTDAPTDTPKDTPTPADAPTDAPADKPFLGDGKPEDAPKDAPKDAPPSEEDYAKALVKDEALLGDDKRIQLDADLYKACIPVMQKYGVSPEAANALANALAKAQVDDAKARMQARIDYFEKMKQESLRTYTPRDFEQINAGIDRWFKPDGVMNQVIRNSELGADPEFLALMHHLGKAVAQDDGAGAAAGTPGAGSANADSIDGMSKLW